MKNVHPVLKKRLITLSISLGLFLFYVALGNLSTYGYIPDYHRFARAMLVVTIIYTMGGCILSTIGKTKAVKVFASVVFLLLCIFIFYSQNTVDFIVFAICMIVVLIRSANLCSSDCDI